MTPNEFLKGAKTYLRMPDGVTVYDEEVLGLIESALASLAVAGITGQKRALVSAYVNTYVRLGMLQDAAPTFRQSETERLRQIINQLTYGGA